VEAIKIAKRMPRGSLLPAQYHPPPSTAGKPTANALPSPHPTTMMPALHHVRHRRRHVAQISTTETKQLVCHWPGPKQETWCRDIREARESIKDWLHDDMDALTGQKPVMDSIEQLSGFSLAWTAVCVLEAAMGGQRKELMLVSLGCRP